MSEKIEKIIPQIDGKMYVEIEKTIYEDSELDKVVSDVISATVKKGCNCILKVRIKS